MSNYTTPRATRYLPQVALATTVVAVLPVAVVWWLHAAGLISSPWLCIVLAIALSLAASFAGNAYWKRRGSSGDLLFSELLLWGWLRRVRVERQLAGGARTLEAAGTGTRPRETPQSTSQTARRLRQLAFALDEQDPYTAGHSRRVAGHAVMIARKMGLSSEEVSQVRSAAAVHDIGKLRIPSELLNKPATLTADEFEVVKRHATEGAEIVACLGDAELCEIVRHHHERFDGTGYPAQLLGEQIPLGARIIAVADTFDALTSIRPYRLATPHKRALRVLESVSGTQLDPVVVRAFLRCYSGNTALVLWTLLAISPKGAAAWLKGRAATPAHVSFGTMVASVAAVTGVAASAITGPAGETPAAYAVTQAPTVRLHHGAAAVKRTRSAGHHRAPARAARVQSSIKAPRVHRARPVAAHRVKARHSAHAAPATAPVPTANPTPSPSGGTGGGGHPGGNSGGGGHKQKPHASPPTTTNPSPAPPAPPAPPPPPPPVTTVSTGGPGPGPTSKDQCKNGGYVQWGFPNQGQCVAFVERG